MGSTQSCIRTDKASSGVVPRRTEAWGVSARRGDQSFQPLPWGFSAGVGDSGVPFSDRVHLFFRARVALLVRMVLRAPW